MPGAQVHGPPLRLQAGSIPASHLSTCWSFGSLIPSVVLSFQALPPASSKSYCPQPLQLAEKLGLLKAPGPPSFLGETALLSAT